MTSTKHAEQARRVSHFLHQTMRDRGINCMRNDLEAALVELTPAQLQQVHASGVALANGADAREDMALLAALRNVSAQATRAALAAAGVIYRADVLLPLASAPTTGPVFTRELARLRRVDLPQSDRDAAATQLRGLCGRLDHSDLLDEAPAPQAPPVPPDIEGSVQNERSDDHSATPATSDPGEGAPRSARRTGQARKARQQVKIYGKAAALTCEAAPVRAQGAGEVALSTLMIEGAKANGDGTFDWPSKIVFACAQRELPQLLAVLLGWHDLAEFKFHGAKAEKGLTLQHQEHGLFVKLRDPGATVAVPIADHDRYALAMLVLGVMADNDASGDRQAVLAVCRAVMAPH